MSSLYALEYDFYDPDKNVALGMIRIGDNRVRLSEWAQREGERMTKQFPGIQIKATVFDMENGEVVHYAGTA